MESEDGLRQLQPLCVRGQHSGDVTLRANEAAEGGHNSLTEGVDGGVCHLVGC